MGTNIIFFLLVAAVTALAREMFKDEEQSDYN